MAEADKEPIRDIITVLTEFCPRFEWKVSASSGIQKSVPSNNPASLQMASKGEAPATQAEASPDSRQPMRHLQRRNIPSSPCHRRKVPSFPSHIVFRALRTGKGNRRSSLFRHRSRTRERRLSPCRNTCRPLYSVAN